MRVLVVKVDAAAVELERHDWSTLRVPYGVTGEVVRETFAKLLGAADVSEAVGWSLEEKVEVQSMVFEVALPAVGVILAAFTRDLPRFVEAEFLNVLEAVITGEPHRAEMERGNTEIVSRCRMAAREGIWVLYGRLERWNAETILNIIDFIETDRDRFEAFAIRYGFQG